MKSSGRCESSNELLTLHISVSASLEQRLSAVVWERKDSLPCGQESTVGIDSLDNVELTDLQMCCDLH